MPARFLKSKSVRRAAMTACAFGMAFLSACGMLPIDFSGSVEEQLPAFPPDTKATPGAGTTVPPPTTTHTATPPGEAGTLAALTTLAGILPPPANILAAVGITIWGTLRFQRRRQRRATDTARSIGGAA